MIEYEVRVTARENVPPADLEILLDHPAFLPWGPVLIEDAPPYVVVAVDATSAVMALAAVAGALPEALDVVGIEVTASEVLA